MRNAPVGVIGGIDCHTDQHVAATLDPLGRHLGLSGAFYLMRIPAAEADIGPTSQFRYSRTSSKNRASNSCKLCPRFASNEVANGTPFLAST